MSDPFNEELLVYYLNTLNVPSCLLVSNLVDLQDGEVVCDLTNALNKDFKSRHTIKSMPSALSRIETALNFLASADEELPLLLRAPNAAERMAAVSLPSLFPSNKMKMFTYVLLCFYFRET